MKTTFDLGKKENQINKKDIHPSIKRYNERKTSAVHPLKTSKLSAKQLREMCTALGIDDVGFVEISQPLLTEQQSEILTAFPWTKTLISIVGRMNKENLRSPARSIASLELQQVEKGLNHAVHELALAFDRQGIRAAAPTAGFPMETDQWPGKLQVISHKPIAVAAGLGKMGLHRNVIHPVFGSFILLNTILIDAELDEYSTPLDYNPCLDCKLCSVACPTGAISSNGNFNFVNCLTHTYRELLGGFADWAENIADSKNAIDYRSRVSDTDTISRWQSLAYGPCYKSVYCIAVCPAGDAVISQYLDDKKNFIETVVKPLQQKKETIYVLSGSDAESHVLNRFPHKEITRVGNGIRPPSIAAFIASMSLAFQPQQSEGLCAIYHFTFSGTEQAKATIVIKDKTIQVSQGHIGIPDLQVHADSKTWLRVLHKETPVLKEILFRKIHVKGPLTLFKAFDKCFV